MIAAGTLKYKLKFKQNQKAQSASGFITNNKVDLFEAKAAIVKNDESFGVKAKENFYTVLLTFKLRYNKLLNEDLIVEFENDEYRIISLFKNEFDNTTTLVIEKIDK